MKIIHCADLHLDSKLSSNLTGAKKKERKAELLHTFERMVDYATQNEVDAIIIAGDLFDTRNISVGAQNTVSQAIVDHADIDFYYLKGNHDTDNFLSEQEKIPDNLKLFGDSWTTYTAGMNEIVSIAGVELNSENSGTVYNSLVLDNDKINILVLHGQESIYQVKDKAECINLTELKNKGIDYLALGHIHSYKKENLDRRGVYCYSGCLEGRGFDECGEHGFVLLTIDEAKRTLSSEFVPFAHRKLYNVPVDISGCMTTTDIRDRTRDVLAESDIADSSLVKLVLTGNVDVECNKNIELLLKYFEDKFYFIKIYDESKLAVDYSAFRLDESLKGEFVRQVMSASDMDDETKAEVIRYGIQALAGGEIG